MYQRFKYILNALLLVLITLSVAGVIYFLFFVDSNSDYTSSSTQSTQNSLELSFKTLEGDTITNKDLVGQITLINFWATWCGPCRLEIPELVELQDHYSNQDVQVIGVSVDRNMDPIDSFLDQYKVNYPISMYSAKHVDFFGHVSAIPTTFILDKKARVAHVLRGFRNQYELHRLIENLQ
ncbi:TlpA family protein disulfide reductase [bacterium]|nr:TlpA family protein disulfide reductase [bacterium]